MVKYRIGKGLGEYTEKNELISNILELALKVDDRPSGVVPERSNISKTFGVTSGTGPSSKVR